MIGPDLTGAGGRYSARDFLDQIINPSKSINEQFVPVIAEMMDGTIHTGVVVNLNNTTFVLNTDMFEPNQRVGVDRLQVKSLEPSKVSPMPPGLLNLMKEEKVMDLVVYV